MRYHYSIAGADDAGEHRHPQVVIMETFPDATDFEPHSMGDCWFFTAAPKTTFPRFFLPCQDDGVPDWRYHTRDVSEAKPLRTVRVEVADGRVLTFRAAEPIRRGQKVAAVDDQTVCVAIGPSDIVVGLAAEHSLPS